MAALRMFLVAVALTAPVWALSAIPARACSCAFNLENLVAEADLIIMGTAVDVALLDPDAVGVGELRRARVESTIDVDTYLLGSGPETILVRSTAEVFNPEGTPSIFFGLSPGCGYAPEPDTRHLLFIGVTEEGEYDTGGCAAFIADEFVHDEYVPEILRLLEEATPQPTVVELPETGTGGPDSGSPSGWQVAAAAGALVAAASIFLVTLRRRLV